MFERSYLIDANSSLLHNCHHFRSKDLVKLRNTFAANQDILTKLRKTFDIPLWGFFCILMPSGLLVNTLPSTNLPPLGQLNCSVQLNCISFACAFSIQSFCGRWRSSEFMHEAEGGAEWLQQTGRRASEALAQDLARKSASSPASHSPPIFSVIMNASRKRRKTTKHFLLLSAKERLKQSV